MQRTKLRAAPVRHAVVPPCAPAGRMDEGTASQLIASVRRTNEAANMPLREVGRSPDLAQGMVIGIVLDVIAIPWTYVVAHYLKRAGDRWR